VGGCGRVMGWVWWEMGWVWCRLIWEMGFVLVLRVWMRFFRVLLHMVLVVVVVGVLVVMALELVSDILSVLQVLCLPWHEVVAMLLGPLVRVIAGVFSFISAIPEPWGARNSGTQFSAVKFWTFSVIRLMTGEVLLSGIGAVEVTWEAFVERLMVLVGWVRGVSAVLRFLVSDGVVSSWRCDGWGHCVI